MFALMDILVIVRTGKISSLSAVSRSPAFMHSSAFTIKEFLMTQDTKPIVLIDAPALHPRSATFEHSWSERWCKKSRWLSKVGLVLGDVPTGDLVGIG